ncbi:hypothetical protein BJI69_18090 [Luteibacter rhizovicinus DSM 16549]|uniref:N-acetyltransferase domain-containing protein n=1 Tax=Luteibacter rhizovicinus DSM 16549 TaxID=1440763 RepID=A0A1L3EX45_9GAMM|nr:GNAT family N-acetyltransferase [Luteibacter rhizovicinus]APG05625.1 hypothetical protein BJI69_18090 [Luteibacter rhizovicinus DSM 16549]
MFERDPVLLNEQFIAFGKLLVAGRPGADTWEKDGMRTYWAGSPAVFFNLIFLSEPVTDRTMLNRRLHVAADYMRSKTDPGLFFISEDYLDNEVHGAFDAALEEAGLVSMIETIGMIGDLSAFEEGSKPAELRFARVTDESGFYECADINSEAYSLPVELMRDGLDGATLWKKSAYCYLAYLGDAAVATASVVEIEDVLYVGLVATRPDAQRRGFAEATVRHALRVASESTGHRKTCLHATQAGYPVYERMGYTPVTRILGFGPAGSSDS